VCSIEGAAVTEYITGTFVFRYLALLAQVPCGIVEKELETRI
jgi:hypothetical protein